MFYCEPKWHRGRSVQAVVHIMPPEPDIQDNGFAACEAHAGRALRVMLRKFKIVRVRDVSTANRRTLERQGE